MQPIITIVTPSFNRVWSIRACIESVQSQANVNYEHLVMDAGSKDGTLDYLDAQAKKDKRLRVITGPDHGMYDAVNKGLKLAQGEIVAYLNTDDFYLPGTLSYVLAEFEKNPNLDMLYGHWLSWFPGRDFLEPQPVLKYGVADLVSFAVLPQPSVFFRRTLFQKLGGFDISYKLLADNEFFSRAAMQGAIFKRVDAYLSVQTVHSGNLLAGNVSAFEQATEEGQRYRAQRLREFVQESSPCKVNWAIWLAKIKNIFLPVIWRMYLIKHLILCFFENGKSLNFPWKKIPSRLKFYLLVKYLLSSSPRERHAYLRVTAKEMLNITGFSVPSYIRGEGSSNQ